MPAKRKTPSKEELFDLYIINEKSFRDLMKHYSTGDRQLRRWLKEYNIPIRPFHGVSKPKPSISKYPPKKVLIKHLSDGLNTNEIALLYDASQGAVSLWIKKYDINYNYIGSPQHRRANKKISNVMIGKNMGEANANWRGGLWNGPTTADYGNEFTDELKERVRARDSYQCQDCGKSTKENGRELEIHHINYEKKCNEMTNLITLCRGCHGKTNFSRDDWIAYFTEKLEHGQYA